MLRNLINSRRNFFLYVFITVAALSMAVLQDLFHAQFNSYHFYLSESLLFNAFWMLFLPLLPLQNHFLSILSKNNFTAKKTVAGLIAVAGVAGIHLLLFPVLLVTCSALFYPHTYRLSQAFAFELSANLLICLAVYSLATIAYLRKNAVEQPRQPVFPPRFTITHGANSIVVSVSDILYVRAATPYISIVASNGKWLHKQTMKDFNNSLDPGLFMRIHKSLIVNLKKVTGVHSRLNGDYDVVLEGGEVVRMSRNYAAAFKARFF